MKELRQLLLLLLPLWIPMVLAVVLGVLTVASSIGLMSVSAFLLASAALHPPLGQLSAAIAGVRLFGLCRAVLRYFERYFSHNATFRLLSRLRVWFYVKMERLDIEELEQYHSGQLLKRMILDVDNLQFFYLRVVAPVAISVVILLAMVYWLCYFASAAAWLVAAGFFATGMLAPAVLQAGRKEMERQISDCREQMHALLLDGVKGLSELSAFDSAGIYQERLNMAGRRLEYLERKKARYFAFADSFGGLGMNLTVWLLLILVIPLVSAGKISGIELSVLALAVQSCFEAVLPLLAAPHFLLESLQALKRIFSLTENKPAEGFGTKAVPERFAIEVRELSFSYDGRKPVLEHFSVSLPVGKRIAVVGANGAGKSTFLSLLLGFRPVQQGTICFNETELRHFAPEELRRKFGVVPQQTHIFHGSIRDNILLAKPDADEDEFLSAAAASGVDAFARWLPEGYDTTVGENGHRLSGGQRQRLAIARVLLKNAPILLLDEPTAGLDNQAARTILADIERATKGKTTIYITHRLQGLETMDEILVMDNGRIVERGDYRRLIAAHGLFYTLWKLQQEAVF